RENGARTVDLTSRPARGGRKPALPKRSIHAPRNDRVPAGHVAHGSLAAPACPALARRRASCCRRGTFCLATVGSLQPGSSECTPRAEKVHPVGDRFYISGRPAVATASATCSDASVVARPAIAFVAKHAPAVEGGDGSSWAGGA